MNANLEIMFKQIVGNNSFHTFSRNFLKEKTQYYKMIGETRADSHMDNFILENYDVFELWCVENNISALYPDLKFQVKGYNC